jgi:hypothetical protein
MIEGRWREFFSVHVPKAKRGANGWWNGFCPFHEDPETSRSPSFGFNANSGGWRCQGCGEHGNAYQFLARIEGRPYDKDSQEDLRWARSVIAERFLELARGGMKKKRSPGGVGTNLSAAEIASIAEMQNYQRGMSSE